MWKILKQSGMHNPTSQLLHWKTVSFLIFFPFRLPFSTQTLHLRAGLFFSPVDVTRDGKWRPSNLPADVPNRTGSSSSFPTTDFIINNLLYWCNLSWIWEKVNYRIFSNMYYWLNIGIQTKIAMYSVFRANWKSV